MIEITSLGLLPLYIDYSEMESRQSDARNKVIAPESSSRARARARVRARAGARATEWTLFSNILEKLSIEPLSMQEIMTT